VWSPRRLAEDDQATIMDLDSQVSSGWLNGAGAIGRFMGGAVHFGPAYDLTACFTKVLGPAILPMGSLLVEVFHVGVSVSCSAMCAPPSGAAEGIVAG
jgi:hypothetical protein